MNKRFLFAFDFDNGTMNGYISNFLQEREIDFFYIMPGVLVADLFGTDTYYQLKVDDIVGNRKEVYYQTDKKYKRNGLKRMYPLTKKVITIKDPTYTIKVFMENNETFTTRINACKQYIFNEYMKQVFNMGIVKDNMQHVAWVEILA